MISKQATEMEHTSDGLFERKTATDTLSSDSDRTDQRLICGVEGRQVRTWFTVTAMEQTSAWDGVEERQPLTLFPMTVIERTSDWKSVEEKSRKDSNRQCPMTAVKQNSDFVE